MWKRSSSSREAVRMRGCTSCSPSPLTSIRLQIRRTRSGDSACGPGWTKPPGGITDAAEPGSCQSMRSWKRRPVRRIVVRAVAGGPPRRTGRPRACDYFFLIQAAGIGAILSLRFSGST